MEDINIIAQRIADLHEQIETHMHESQAKQNQFDTMLSHRRTVVDEKLKTIATDIHSFRSIMSRTGFHEWRQESERFAQQTSHELQILSNTYQQVKASVMQGCESLQHASMNTVKTVAKLVSSFRGNDFKRVTDKHTDELKEISQANLSQIEHAVHRFHWKNLTMVVIITLIVSFLTSVYIDGELPWQMHRQIVREREAGKALTHDWTKLSQADQKTIINDA